MDFRLRQVNDWIRGDQNRYVRESQGSEQLLGPGLKNVGYDDGCRDSSFLEFDAGVDTPHRAAPSIGDSRYHEIALLGQGIDLRADLPNALWMRKLPIRVAGKGGLDAGFLPELPG